MKGQRRRRRAPRPESAASGSRARHQEGTRAGRRRSWGRSATPSVSNPPPPLSADGRPPRRSRPLRLEKLAARRRPCSGRNDWPARGRAAAARPRTRVPLRPCPRWTQSLPPGPRRSVRGGSSEGATASAACVAAGGRGQKLARAPAGAHGQPLRDGAAAGLGRPSRRG